MLYGFPNDDDLTVAAVFLTKDRLPVFKADKEGEFVRAFATLSRRPRLEDATRVSTLIGKLDVPNVRAPRGPARHRVRRRRRPGQRPCLGCRGRLRAAVGGVAGRRGRRPAAGRRRRRRGLERYRRRHRRHLSLHHLQMAEFARGRRLNALERTLHRAATHDPQTAQLMHELASHAEPLDRCAPGAARAPP